MPESEPKPRLIELVAPGAGQGWKAVLKNGKAAVIHEIAAPAAEAAAAIPRIQRLADHRHPALAPVLAWGTDPNGLWVAVEPNEGTPLGTILSRGPLTPPAAAALGAALLSGVAALHEAGIAMGGFGATAVRVTGNGEVRLSGHPAAAVRGAPSQSDLRADVRSCGMAICAGFGVDPAGAPAPPSIPPGLVVTMRSMASGAMGPAADRAQGALREMASALLAPDRMAAAQAELATRAGGREMPSITPFLPKTEAPAPAPPAPAPPPSQATWGPPRAEETPLPAAASYEPPPRAPEPPHPAPPAPPPYVPPPRRDETPAPSPFSYEPPPRPLETYPAASAPPAPPEPAAPPPPAPAPVVPTWDAIPASPSAPSEPAAPTPTSTWDPAPLPAPTSAAPAPPVPADKPTWTSIPTPAWNPTQKAPPVEPAALTPPTITPAPSPIRAPAPAPARKPPAPRRPSRDQPSERPPWLIPAAVGVIVLLLLGAVGGIYLATRGGKSHNTATASPTTKSSPKITPSPSQIAGPLPVPTNYAPASATPVASVQFCTSATPCKASGLPDATDTRCDLAGSCVVDVGIYYSPLYGGPISYIIKFFDRCTGVETDLPGGSGRAGNSTFPKFNVSEVSATIHIPSGAKSAGIVAVTTTPAGAASAPLLLGADSCT